jgi:hypothetical protein
MSTGCVDAHSAFAAFVSCHFNFSLLIQIDSAPSPLKSQATGDGNCRSACDLHFRHHHFVAETE